MYFQIKLNTVCVPSIVFAAFERTKKKIKRDQPETSLHGSLPEKSSQFLWTNSDTPKFVSKQYNQSLKRNCLMAVRRLRKTES